MRTKSSRRPTRREAPTADRVVKEVALPTPWNWLGDSTESGSEIDNWRGVLHVILSTDRDENQLTVMYRMMYA